MDKISAMLGLGISFVLMIMGIGFPNFGNYIDPPSIAIVIGGTVGSVLITSGITGLKASIQLIQVALTRTDVDRTNELIRVYNLATKARRKNLLALEEDCQAIEDEFLRQGLQMIIDGISPDVVRNILEKEIENTAQRHTASHDILNVMAEAAPAFGMVGFYNDAPYVEKSA